MVRFVEWGIRNTPTWIFSLLFVTFWSWAVRIFHARNVGDTNQTPNMSCSRCCHIGCILCRRRKFHGNTMFQQHSWARRTCRFRRSSSECNSREALSLTPALAPTHECKYNDDNQQPTESNDLSLSLSLSLDITYCSHHTSRTWRIAGMSAIPKTRVVSAGSRTWWPRTENRRTFCGTPICCRKLNGAHKRRSGSRARFCDAAFSKQRPRALWHANCSLVLFLCEIVESWMPALVLCRMPASVCLMPETKSINARFCFCECPLSWTRAYLLCTIRTIMPAYTLFNCPLSANVDYVNARCLCHRAYVMPVKRQCRLC